jgi:hypothetical protein
MTSLAGRSGRIRETREARTVRVLRVATAALLAAACIAWSATPVRSSGGAGALLLAAGAGCAALAMAQLAIGPVQAPPALPDIGERIAGAAGIVVRSLPWAEGMVVVVLLLEVRHPARPWHTALLGAALVTFLLAVHLAESGAGPRVLWPAALPLTAGLAMLALAAGAASLPVPGSGPSAAWLIVLASIAALLAALLAIPA